MLPVVGVSACLLGHHVRYDGKHKYTHLIADELEKRCSLVAVCPEVEIGLGIPRPKIQLTQMGASIRVLQKDDSNIDITDSLVKFAIKFVNQHSFKGMVLQDKSPSCGIGNTKLFSQSGEQIGISSGLFATTIMDFLPDLVVIQASQLQSKEAIDQFVKKLQ